VRHRGGAADASRVKRISATHAAAKAARMTAKAATARMTAKATAARMTSKATAAVTATATAMRR
jgi:hypothetical protein